MTQRPQHCPICRDPSAEAFQPFCSKRCADVDLGRWLTGRYVVPDDASEADTDDGAKSSSGRETDEAG